ncbi:MAG: hypothetical protein AMXMBFR13_06650 [Phycisphaerae bacterium]
MIPVLEVTANGDIETLWTDELDLYEIGRITNVRNASTVEFNEERQEWEVISAADGQVVHRDRNRERAIEWEIENFGSGGPLYRGDGSV